MTKLEAALDWAQNGGAVFPCNRDKRPCIPKDEGGNGFHDATTDLNQIREWSKRFPDCNWGAACIKFQVLDLDDGGEETLAKYPPFPVCPEVLTPSGGRHLYLSANSPPLKNTKGFLPGLDSRTVNKGYVILPPGETEDGIYEWVVKLGEAKLAPVPDWMIDILRVDKESDFGPRLVVPEVLEEGGRNDTLFKWACRLRREDMPIEQALHTLQTYNSANCKPPLSENEIKIIVGSAYKYKPEPIRVEISAPTVEVARSGDIGSFRPTAPKTGVPTGFSIIDDHTKCHGLPDGQTTIVVADTNGGKTAFLIQLAYQIAKEGLPVCFATFADLPGEDLYERLLQLITGWQTEPFDAYENEKWHRAHDEIASLPIHIYDASDLESGFDVKRFCTWFLEHGGRFAVAMVDYAQELVYDESKDTSEYDEARHVSKKLRWLASKSKVPVVIASQMTEGNAKAGTKTITKGSRWWGHRAALVLGIERLTQEQANNLEDSEFRGLENLTELHLSKNRYGKKNLKAFAKWSDFHLSLEEL